MGEMHRQKLNVRDEETEDRCERNAQNKREI